MSKTATATWKTLLENTLNENREKSKDIFNVAVGTIEANRPRVRMMVHRGFAPDSEILLSTTDIRMHKVQQFQHSYTRNAGAPLEYVFWIEPAMRQFRIQANAYLIPSPSVKREYDPTPLSNYLIQSGIDFEKQRVEIYDNMSRTLRAAFAKPYAPGSHRTGTENLDEYPDKVPTDSQDKWYRSGLDNFTLVVIDPTQVDYCDLLTQPNQRKIWRKDAVNRWSEEDVHP